MAQGALQGVRVIEIAQEIQGPFAGLLLADLGAEVIKIENCETGDLARRTTVGAVSRGEPVPHADFQQYFFMLNRGKRSVTLNLKSEEGKQILMRLLGDADVLLTNFRPGVLERLGFGYEALSQRLPRLIYAVASSWGPRGPWARRPSRDMLAQAASGLMAKTGKDGDQPLPAGMVVADYAGAMTAFSGVLAALYARERTGQGQRVDVSMYGSMLALQSWEILQTSLTGRENHRAGRGHQFLHGVWGAFRTRDGWVAIAGVEDDRWPRFCKIIGREDLADAPEFDREHRNFKGDKVQAVLDEIIPTRTTAEWMQDFDAADLFATPVVQYLDVLDSEQAQANGYIRWVEHPEHGRFRIVGHPMEFSSTPVRYADRMPGHGEHTEELLSEHGFGPDDIAALKRKGIV
ncbi:CaiB/BaiF CoA transferase family protein [Sinimarinibacterium flocculans]|uniref:CaiB/BaiF CoA transferase family protein n=1 Tax=Sinimarinibacterium flocculans TaxID=985250 RepID=UPI002491E74C|nr:CoA transferase [Sinimarinibacterium flocculans]